MGCWLVKWGIGAPKPLGYPIKTLGSLNIPCGGRSIENKTQMGHFAAVFPASNLLHLGAKQTPKTVKNGVLACKMGYRTPFTHLRPH